MSAPTFAFTARLLESYTGATPPEPGSWFITHLLGGPAAGTYTEVQFDGTQLDDRVLEQVVREVAGQLYGIAYAFTYRPEQYFDAIARHGLRLRERVLVEGIEVWS